MNLLKVIAGYTNYNHWANHTMTQWLKTLDKNILYQETPSSFGSIDLTMQHMVHAQSFWLTVVTKGYAEAAKQNDTIRMQVVDIIMSDLISSSQEMIDTFTGFTETELLEQLPTESMIQSRYEYLIHAINHNTHHRVL